jgi:hypothetical protein
MISFRRALGGSVLVLALAAGCGSNGLGGLGGGGSASASTNHAPPENTAAPMDALTDPTHPGLSSCTGSVSQNDVDDALEIASDFKESCHELIVCGGLATNLGSAIVSILLNAALGGGSVQFTYMGNGTYQTGNAGPGTTMTIQTFLGFDTSFGKKGDVINFDITDITNYFTGAKVVATASFNTKGESHYSLGVTFDHVGPAVELLGLGATPASPLTVDADKINATLGQIQVHTKIHVDDKQGHSIFTYDVDTPTQSLSSALSGDPMGYSLVGVTGSRMDTTQTLTITKWQINYLDTGASGYMDGTIGFSIKGGKFDYSSTFVYPRRKTPDVTLACGG